jgi:hypothetical protein
MRIWLKSGFTQKCYFYRNLACRTLYGDMERHVINGLYVMLLVAVIVSVDFLFFKREFWERLIANIGIVLVFVAFYLRFIKESMTLQMAS